MNELEHEFWYSRGHVNYNSCPFGQYCTTARITTDGHLQVVFHEDRNFEVLEDRDLTTREFDELASRIKAWREEASEHGQQSEEKYGIHNWDQGAYWTNEEDIEKPRLKQLAHWLKTNIPLAILRVEKS